MSCATSLTLTVLPPAPAGRDQQIAHRRRIAERLVEPQQDLELIVAVLELRHFFAADQRAQVVGQRVDVDAEVGRARAVDVDAQLGLRRLEVRVDVHDAGNLAHLVHQLHGVVLQLLDVGTLNQDVEAVEAAAAAAARPAAAAAAAAAVEAPEMSVPPETLIRAPWYLRSICARPDHQLLLRDVPLLERHHHDVEVREAGVDVLHHALQPGSASTSFSIGLMNSSVRW